MEMFLAVSNLLNVVWLLIFFDRFSIKNLHSLP